MNMILLYQTFDIGSREPSGFWSKECGCKSMLTTRGGGEKASSSVDKTDRTSPQRASEQVFHARNRVGCAPLFCFAFFWKGRERAGKVGKQCDQSFLPY
jgi:hypothetical protein